MDICKECVVDYHGRTMCTKCVMPLANFFGNMHEPTQHIHENKEK